MEYLQVGGALTDCLHLAQQQGFQIQAIQAGILSLKPIPCEVIVDVFRGDPAECSEQGFQAAMQVV